jgi:hypothetical protein
MKQKTMTFSLLFLLAVMTIHSVGCSYVSRPSDEEVIKAIDDSGVLKSESFTITSPLTVVERSSQNKDGSWTFRVKMIMTMRLSNGTVSEPKENSTYFRIFKAKDGSGKNVWKARLGK